MRILVSNDDGYQAPGLKALVHALESLGTVTVVAPDRDRSGASNSLTLVRPLRVQNNDNGYLSVDGTPTDCVHLALTALLDEQPDVVVSGINAGANLGDDVLYSGTVAAAMEGRFLGLPAIAISLASEPPHDYRYAAEWAVRLVAALPELELPAGALLNVNVPECDGGPPRGLKMTRLGQRHKSEPVIADTDPRGKTIYWIGPAGPEDDSGPNTDFQAVREGYVSVSAIRTDLSLDAVRLKPWLDGF